MIDVQTTGLREVQGALKRFPKEVRSDLPKIVKQAAEPVRARAQALAPRRTGALADSIRIVGGLNKVAVRAGGKGPFYARFQEYGTKFMAANPYLRPAVKERGPAVRPIIEHELRQIIGRVF